MEIQKSKIVDFYEGSTIFLTGGTGFLGKLFIEKLLRTCNDLNCIYLLVRTKKGKDVQTRFEEIFRTPNFDPLYRLYPNFISKLRLIPGDCALPDLGLSEEDKQKLISEVNIVIHCAATVRFDQDLRTAAYINVRSVRDIIEMCKQMKNLKSVLYISTAYSNCVRLHIDETFYEPPFNFEKLFSLIEALDDDQLVKAANIVLGDWPNTYAFTKAVAEDLVNSEGKSLPIIIYRPSIVIATAKEPIAGWIDNVYGATGLFVASALGVLHTCQGFRTNYTDIVPADYVINGALASLWEMGTREETKKDEIPIYNYVSYAENPITWDQAVYYWEIYGPTVPTRLAVWHYFFTSVSNRQVYLLLSFFYHTIPAYIADFICICIGKEPLLVKSYEKIKNFTDVTSYFAMREFTFSNNNTQKLWEIMSTKDQELFAFSIKLLDWEEYFITYIKGARVYILKDPMDTIPAGKVKYMKLKYAHYTLLTILTFVLYKISSALFYWLFM